MLHANALSYLAVLTLCAAACGGETVQTRTVDTGSGGTSGTSGTDGTSSSDGTSSTDGTSGSDGTSGTSGTSGTDGVDASEGTDGVDGTSGAVVVNKCGIDDNPDGLGIGMPCTDHMECETGYCYTEELWNEDSSQTYRFCTAGCAGCTVKGNCNEWKKAPGVNANSCFPFTSSFIKYFGLEVTSLCLTACQSDAECANLGSFNTCAKLTFGKDYDYGVQKVCQPESFPKLDPDEF